MSRIRWYGPTALLLMTVVLAMLLGPGMVRSIARSYESARIEEVRQGLVDNPTLTTMSDAFKDVARVVEPSVTSISLLAPDLLAPRSLRGRLEVVSNGSGWVYRHYNHDNPKDYEDFIITNHHVVEDLLLGRAEQAVVRFDDGGEYRATIVGTDPQADVAVLRIDRSDLIPAALAKRPAEQGEIVFAFGSPFQFEFSMSQGIVSATGRRLRSSRVNTYENYIQTDAAINPGNSGGPLTNVRGEVIGMNTAIAVEGNPAATFSGLGFAIPIDQIIAVADQLIENGEVRRGYMGVFIQELDFASAQAMGFIGKGVLAVPAAGGPAELAGIELGDVITHVDGQPVATGEELRIAVSNHPPGTVVPIRVWRAGEALTFDVTLSQDPRELAGAITPQRLPDDPFDAITDSDAAKLGLGRIETFTPETAAMLGWPYTPGVLVRLVERGSPAETARLERMSLISAVDDRPVNGVMALAEQLEQAAGGPVTLTIRRWNPAGNGGYEDREVQLSPR